MQSAWKERKNKVRRKCDRVLLQFCAKKPNILHFILYIYSSIIFNTNLGSFSSNYYVNFWWKKRKDFPLAFPPQDSVDLKETLQLHKAFGHFIFLLKIFGLENTRRFSHFSSPFCIKNRYFSVKLTKKSKSLKSFNAMVLKWALCRVEWIDIISSCQSRVLLISLWNLKSF